MALIYKIYELIKNEKMKKILDLSILYKILYLHLNYKIN